MQQIESNVSADSLHEIEHPKSQARAVETSGLTGKLIVGNCVDVMREWEDGSIQLTVTSPPYDKLRNYNGYDFPFKEIANELYRITANGGVVVWVVGDRINGGRTLTSFRQAIYFQEIGFGCS